MPDNILQIGAQVTIGELKAGMDQAVASTRAAGGEMSAAFQALAAESQAATTEISSAWVRAAESSVVFSRAKDQVRAASRAAKQAEDDDGAALASLAVAQQRAAAAAAELAAAQRATAASANEAAGAAEELAVATGHTGAQMAYASGAIRVFAGEMPIRAVERFLTETLGLGPILSAAFPIVGLVALGEMLATVAGKVADLYQNFVELKEVQEEVAGVEERMARATIASFEQSQRFAEEHLRNTGKLVDAAQLHLQNLQSQPIDLGQFLKTDEIDKKLKQLPEGMREEFKRIFTSILPGDISGLTDRLKTGIGSARAELEAAQRRQAATETSLVGAPYGGAAAIGPGMLTERDVNQQKALIDLYSGLLQYLQQQQQQYAGETQVATDQVGRAHEEQARKAEEAVRQAQAAMRQKMEALRASDEAALDEMRATGTLSLGTEQRFLEQRLAVEAAYPARVRALRHQLSEVLQREAEEQIKINVALVKSVEESNRAMEEAEKQDTAAFQKDLDDRLRQEQEDLKKQQAIDKARLEGALEADEQQLRMQQAQQERQQTLGGGGGWNPLAGITEEIASLKQQQAIEEKILALKVQQARIDAETETDMAKREADLNKLAQLQAQYNLKVYQDQTQALAQQKQQYQTFFTGLTQTFNTNLNQWIEGQKKFGQAMAATWNQITMSVIEDLEKMIEEKLIMAAVDKLLGMTGVSGQAAANASLTSSNDTLAQSNVGVAATQTLADAIEAYGLEGIPIGIALGEGVKAAGESMAAGAFQQGGLVPSTGLHFLHAQEMVLPAALSRHVLETAGGGGGATSAGATHVHVHYSPTINGSGSDLKSVLSAHADHIGDIVQKQMRKGRLPSA